MDEQKPQRKIMTKEEKRIQADQITQHVEAETAANTKARLEKTARLRELRLAKERQEKQGK